MRPVSSLSRKAAGTLSLIALLSVSAARAADRDKLSPDLVDLVPQQAGRSAAATQAGSVRPGGQAQRIKVIVRTRGPMTRAARRGVAAQVGRLGRTFDSVGSMVVEATPEQLLALTDDPNVLSLSPDRPVRSTAELDVNRQAIGVGGEGTVNRAALPYSGWGVGVAVIDSGVAPVPDILKQVVAFKDFVSGQDARPYDDYGHGTHVAGIIAGSGASSSGPFATSSYRGAAPGAHIISAKVLDANGGGSVSNVIAAIDWCIANRDALKIRVINLSLGGGVYESYKTDPLCQAAERAVAAGIVVVTTAGNWGGWYGTVGAPGNHPDVITVGASNTRGTVRRGDDAITSYTGRGPTRFDVNFKPDILAPGNDIVSLRAPGSTLDRLYPETQVPTEEYIDPRFPMNRPTGYTRLSGTSMAAPAVAAGAALALDANPSLTPNGVKAALMFSAQLLSGYDPVTKQRGVYDPLTQGAGELNLVGATQMARLMTPGAGLTSLPAMTSTIGGESFSWAGAEIPGLIERPGLVWGDNLVWGGTGRTTFEDAQAVWGNNLVWGGTGRTAGWNDGLVWGTNLVWGGTGIVPPPENQLIWANNLVWGGTGRATSGETEPGLINGNNLVWGGTGRTLPDDPGIWGNNLVWGGTGLVRPDPIQEP